MAQYLDSSYGMHDIHEKGDSHVESRQADVETEYVSYNTYPRGPSPTTFNLSQKDLGNFDNHYNGNYNGNYSGNYSGNYNGNYNGNNHTEYTTTEYTEDAQGYQQQHVQERHVYNTVTPGADNFSESAAGGVAAIAYGVAERNGGRGGDMAPPRNMSSRLPPPPSQTHAPSMPRMAYPDGQGNRGRYSPGSAGAPAPPALYPPSSRSPAGSLQGDNYQLHSSNSRNNSSSFGMVNPNDIMDDGDDGLDYSRSGLQDSGSGSRGGRGAGVGAAAAGAAVVAGGAAAAGSGMREVQGSKGGDQMTEYDITTGQEKTPEWAAKKASKRRMWKWIIIVAVILVIIGAVVGGVVGSMAGGKKKGSKSADSSSSGSSGTGGGKDSNLNINSPEIRTLLNNKNLHKVFPGMDYTPQNTQYPDCLVNPPSQDDITKDVAVLSQLTNIIRLYGTDCNQTEMVLFAIKQLQMTDTLHLWLGVWQDNNATTNARQLAQMWRILDTYGTKPFLGAIIGNEVLFRQQLTATSLGRLLDDIRANMTAHNYNIPVATSDLGDDWTAALAAESDCVMGNVHPFFSGVEVQDAAGWTWDFWTQHDGPFFKKDASRNIISETGWPSGGGTDCGGAATCTGGSVAGINEMNRFMDDWVCQALANGTNYFWFEAFDEPWKVSFNTPGKEWEDKWGLMYVNRTLKEGIKIPDCGGQTVPSA